MPRFLFLTLLLASCGPPGFADLARPAITLYEDESGGGVCVSSFAVDANGAVWAGRDCGADERPLSVVAQVTAADRGSLDTQLDAVLALPNDGDCGAPSWSGARYRFRRTLPGTNDWPQKEFCEPGIDLTALALIDRIEGLAHATGDAATPADAGP